MIPLDVRELLEAPNYVHLSTLRANGSPRNHVVWVGLEGDNVLVCTSDYEERPDAGVRYMDPISIKYTGEPFPSRGADRVCFVIAIDRAAAQTLGFEHRPGSVGQDA